MQKLTLKGICTFCFLILFFQAFNQAPSPDWSYKDPKEDSLAGISLYKAYDLLKGRQAQEVIVAVIDDGVDYTHEDLKDVIWINPGEIAGNGRDDDQNGYVDDLHGWNFMGAPDGKTYFMDQAEVAQIYQMWKKKYDRASPNQLGEKEKREYKIYLEAKKEATKEFAAAKMRWKLVKDTSKLIRKLQKLAPEFGNQPPSVQAISKILSGKSKSKNNLKDFLTSMRPDRYQSYTEMVAAIRKNLPRIRNTASNNYFYSYNPKYYPRNITGDDPANETQRHYGAPTLHNAQPDLATRPISSHGSHVAGIIGATRGNGKGIDGVADHVKIMTLGAVPSGGDERDKDVANAIRYAVDNGAKVINMSFGKLYSPHKQEVDAAYRYAEEHDVLICHLSHNFATDIDQTPYYPVVEMLNGEKVTNVIRVGNSTWNLNEKLPASSSNYGAESVDVFAPGTQIYSTVPVNTYAYYNGTSMATPCVAGLAALLRSYFPDLTAQQTKEIIKKSVFKPNFEVIRPGAGDKVPMSRLCNTGGIINAYQAVQLALARK